MLLNSSKIDALHCNSIAAVRPHGQPSQNAHLVPAVSDPPRLLMINSTDGRSSTSVGASFMFGFATKPFGRVRLFLHLASLYSSHNIRSCAVSDAAISSVMVPHRKIFFPKCSKWLHTSAPLRSTVGSNGFVHAAKTRHS